MSSEAPASPAHFALWTGRAGLRNTLACLALALPCALGLLWLAEHRAEPTCRAWGEARGLVFTGVEHFSRDESTTVCMFTQADGQTEQASFQKMAPFLTDLWVSFALDIKFTLPVFAVLFGVLRTLAFRAGQASRK